MDTLPGTNVSTGSWAQFQQRMQLRREATCLTALRRAMEAGDYEAALERANELAGIDERWNEAKAFLEQVIARKDRPGTIRTPATPPSRPVAPPEPPQSAPEPPLQTAPEPRVQSAPEPRLKSAKQLVPSAAAIATEPPPRPRAGRHRARRALLVAATMLALAAAAGWMLARFVWNDRLAWLMPAQISEPPRPANAPEPFVPPSSVAEVPELPPFSNAAPPAPRPDQDSDRNEPSQKGNGPPASAGPEPKLDRSAPPQSQAQSAEERPTRTPTAPLTSSTNTAEVTTPTSSTIPPPLPPQTAAPVPRPDPPRVTEQPPLPAVPTLPAGTMGTSTTGSTAPPTTGAQPPASGTGSATGTTGAGSGSDVGTSPPASTSSPGTSTSSTPIGAPAADPDEQMLRQRQADAQAISTTLGAYAQAYTSRDAAAVKHVWPAVNSEALRYAFEQLESQRVAFSGCNVDIRGLHAAAACRGTASYVPRVGNRSAVSASHVWTFALRKVVNTWVIESATIK